jgi:hypothetical protein
MFCIRQALGFAFYCDPLQMTSVFEYAGSVYGCKVKRLFMQLALLPMEFSWIAKSGGCDWETTLTYAIIKYETNLYDIFGKTRLETIGFALF